MKEKAQIILKAIESQYNLGSCFNLDIIIYGKKAYLTSVALENDYTKEIDTKDLGNIIGESILLNGMFTSNDYGDWLNEPSYKELKEIVRFKEEDFDFDIDLLKTWELARVICNKNARVEDKSLYYISYNKEYGVMFEKFDNEEELENYLNDYNYYEMIEENEE